MKKIVVFTLGCKVNDCESASLINSLSKKGFEVTDELCFADIYIVNTCAVTSEAEKKSRQMIARIKKYNDNAKIIICGCASQKNPEAFLQKENVTVVTGARQKSKIVEIVEEENLKKERVVCNDDTVFDEMDTPKFLKTRAFIKIQDGCNRFCSYCIIPYLRGRSRSRNIDSIVEEIKNCSSDEVVITGIDISTYNYNGNNLADLMTMLTDVDKRIRLGSLEVSVVTDELLENCKKLKNFASQFHLSLQSGSNNVLKKMNRKYTREEYLEKVEKIYRVFPDCAITTDIIVGFPTESEEDFEDTIDLVKRVKFSQIHAFPYSAREGTNAFKLKDLKGEIKHERLKRLIDVGEKLKVEYLEKYIGKELDFLFEEFVDGFSTGYSKNYIKLYVEGNVGQGIKKVKGIKLVKDGLYAELI